MLACLYLPVLLAYLQVSYCSFSKHEVSLNTSEPVRHRREGRRPFRCETVCPSEIVVGNLPLFALSGHRFFAMEKQFGNFTLKLKGFSGDNLTRQPFHSPLEWPFCSDHVGMAVLERKG